MPARPMAATRMSARRQTPGRSWVLEWQTVTVAFAFRRSIATGLPTMSLRPTTTASCPATGIALRFKKPDVHGMKSVDVLGGIDCEQNFLGVYLWRQG